MRIETNDFKKIAGEFLDVLNRNKVDSNEALEGMVGFEGLTSDDVCVLIGAAKREGPKSYLLECMVNNVVTPLNRSKYAVAPITIQIDTKSDKVIYVLRFSGKIDDYKIHNTDFFGNIIQSKISKPAYLSDAKKELERLSGL